MCIYIFHSECHSINKARERGENEKERFFHISGQYTFALCHVLRQKIYLEHKQDAILLRIFIKHGNRGI